MARAHPVPAVCVPVVDPGMTRRVPCCCWLVAGWAHQRRSVDPTRGSRVYMLNLKGGTRKLDERETLMGL
jgi:hypothetical protein